LYDFLVAFLRNFLAHVFCIIFQRDLGPVTGVKGDSRAESGLQWTVTTSADKLQLCNLT